MVETKKDFSALAAIPTKHAAGVQPVYTLTDILKNPLFVIVPNATDEAREFITQSGRVKITSPKLGANEADVCHALITIAKEGGFRSQEIEFITKQLLDTMKWGHSGAEYRRLKEALRNLCDVRIEMEGESTWSYSSLFHDASIWRQEHDGQEILFKSTISMGKQVFDYCVANRLQGIHPHYYMLKSRLAKSMFEKLCAYATGDKVWSVDLFQLRDLIPLEGVKYQTVSGIKQAIVPVLDYFMQNNIITDYQFVVGRHRKEVTLTIAINAEYFYERVAPTTKKSLAGSADLSAEQLALANALQARGVTESTARRITKGKPLALIARQVEHWDFLFFRRKQGSTEKVPKSGAWLVKAIEGDYLPPEGFQAWCAQRVEREARMAQAVTAAAQAAKVGEWQIVRSVAEDGLRAGSCEPLEKLLKQARQLLEEQARRLQEQQAAIRQRVLEYLPRATDAEWQAACEKAARDGGSYAAEEAKRGRDSILAQIALKELLSERFATGDQ